MRARKRRFYRQRHRERRGWHTRELIQCWCGAVGTYEELFSNDCYDTCGGLRTLECMCGGDFCVCHNHGTIECPGCDDCEGDRDEQDDWYDGYDDDEDY